MKVFIAVDMEGVAGLVQWDEPRLHQERRFITEEANSAVRGAFSGGAAEVLVGESHGNMRNLLPELLDPRAGFVSGQPKPMNHMGGVDASFDLALFAGYHAKAGTLHAVMAHTLRGTYSHSPSMVWRSVRSELTLHCAGSTGWRSAWLPATWPRARKLNRSWAM